MRHGEWPLADRPLARSEEIALSSLIFRIHAALTIPPRPTPRRRKGEKKEINGKWKTPIGFCGVFVQQIQHRFSHRLQSRAGGGEGERDRSGRTPIERCKLLLKASQLCAGGRAKIHSPQSGWMERALCSGVEQERGLSGILANGWVR